MVKSPTKKNKFTLTRRSPDDKTFMIRGDGSTRLQILHELWEEKKSEANDG